MLDMTSPESLPANPPPVAFPWNKTSIDELIRLWGENKSAGEIADELKQQFGAFVTRSAVLGKKHRLKLPRRDCDRFAITGPKVPREPRKPRKQRFVFGRNCSPVEASPYIPPVIVEPDIPFEDRKTILDLTNSTCRWPLGDPRDADFRYCGVDEADLAAGHSYCRFHSKLVYHTPPVLTEAEHTRRVLLGKRQAMRNNPVFGAVRR